MCLNKKSQYFTNIITYCIHEIIYLNNVELACVFGPRKLVNEIPLDLTLKGVPFSNFMGAPMDLF